MKSTYIALSVFALGVALTTLGNVPKPKVTESQVSAFARDPAPRVPPSSVTEDLSGSPSMPFALPDADALPAVASALANKQRLQEELAKTSSDAVRQAGQHLLQEQTRYNDILSSYDDTYRTYSQRVAAHAPPSELSSYQLRLDELLHELTVSSRSLYALSNTLKDAYVSDKVAALSHRISP